MGKSAASIKAGLVEATAHAKGDKGGAGACVHRPNAGGARGKQTKTTKAATGDIGKLGVRIEFGRLVEPMARGREWYADAWKIAEKARISDDMIARIAAKWHYLKSPYLFLERGDGEHKVWPEITPEVFALISACLLIQRVEEMQDAERAGTLTDLDTSIGLFWLCRFAWNMTKAKVTPAAARAVLSAGGTKAADARHDAPGGSRDSRRTTWELFLSGDYGKKKDAAAEIIAPIVGKSFFVTRRYLQGNPPADLKSSA